MGAEAERMKRGISWWVRGLLVLGSFLSGGLLLGCVGPEDSRWRGEQAVSQDAELERLKKAADSSSSPGPVFQLGQAYQQRGLWIQAAESYQEALRIDPQHIESLFAMAELCLQMKLNKEAIRWIRRIEKLAPQKAAVQRRCGFLYEAAQQHQRAEAAWRRALSLNPQDEETRKGLVFLLAAQDRWKEAQEIAERTKSAATYRLLGQVFLTKQRPAEALAQFQKAVRLDPSSAEAHLNCADAWIGCNDFEAAERSLQRARQLAPRSAVPWVRLGLLYDKQQRWQEAVSAYQSALERDPEEAVAANNLAFHYASRRENLKEALRLAQLAYRKLPQSPNVRDTLAFTYQALGQYEKALPLLERLTREFPQDPQFHYHLALVYQGLNRTRAARASAQQALALNDQFREAANCRALLQRIGAPASLSAP